MNITLPKLDTSHLSPIDAALLKCRTALDLRDNSDYAGALGVMHPLWKEVGERPDLKGLPRDVAAEVLLTVGILTSWIGSKEGIERAQETAKNLISESGGLYEAIEDTKMVAASRAEIAYCYFREGALNEARIMLTEALEKLTVEGNTRARALLKLVTVEWSASRYNVALGILNDNAYLFEKVTNHTIRGNYHNELAIVLRNLATSEKRSDYFHQAIKEYGKADHHFTLAKNTIFRADVKNNLGFLLYKLSRFKEAHEYLDQARRLTVALKDKVGTAQIDDTRAQVLIAQRRFKEAETVARHAVYVLEKSGHQCLLADVLTTHGIALARLKDTERAQFAFQKAMEVAHQVGALNKAGMAALTLIEEIEGLSPDVVEQAYDRASEWLATSQSKRYCKGSLLSRRRSGRTQS
jgi:tetratricopeptide (TPR) repeat protein